MLPHRICVGVQERIAKAYFPSEKTSELEITISLGSYYLALFGTLIIFPFLQKQKNKKNIFPKCSLLKTICFHSLVVFFFVLLCNIMKFIHGACKFSNFRMSYVGSNRHLETCHFLLLSCSKTASF